MRFDHANRYLGRLLPHTSPDLLRGHVGGVVTPPAVIPRVGLHVVRGVGGGAGRRSLSVRVVSLRPDLVGRDVVQALLGAGRGLLLELLGLVPRPGLCTLATTAPVVEIFSLNARVCLLAWACARLVSRLNSDLLRGTCACALQVQAQVQVQVHVRVQEQVQV